MNQSSKRFRALVIDDEADIRELLEITLSRMGADTWSAANVESGKQLLGEREYDICLTDMRMPDGSGMDILRHIQKEHPQLPTAVITAFGNVEDAVESLKAGAFDFISKPVDLPTLQRLIEKAVNLPKAPSSPTAQDAPQLIGESPTIQALRTLISKLARSQAPVYISGESGTGKELVARQIHAQGARADMPFVPVNCGAIPTELMESELFGHIKGSFTGATSDKPGLFQSADGGTLFLDEVADLPLHMQVKLLRAIQERKIRPVGAHQEDNIDVRILSATHKPLAKLVETGEFRQDLFYRLNVIQINVPALRERTEDIPQLCNTILGRLSGGSDLSLSKDALTTLNHYPFPGNVRELENILERAVTLADGETIEAGDLLLPSNVAHPIEAPNPLDITNQIEQKEREMIEEALEKTKHNKTKAAELLGLSFRQLRYRLKKLNIN